MSEVIESWATTHSERTKFESQVRALIGRSPSDVAYLDPAGSDPWRIKYHRGFDEASMGVELRSAEGWFGLRWLMHGEREGLALVLNQTVPDLQRDRLKRMPAGTRPNWRHVMTSQVTKLGISWHEPTAGVAAVWAVRLGFSSGHSVVVALGEWRDENIRYIPDAVVAIFDDEIARGYRIPAGEVSAWGRDVG